MAASIGAAAASRIYHAFVTLILARLNGLAPRQIVAFTPPEQEADFASLSPDWLALPQSDGDLGRRMQAYFDEAFAAGCSHVLLLGSDSPNLPRRYVQQALDLLESRDVVLGPTVDGGYYLIGARSQTPDVFTDVQWSSPRVWEQTIANVRTAGLSWGELPQWYDVDDADDLHRLRSDLATTDEPALVQLRQLIEHELQI